MIDLENLNAEEFKNWLLEDSSRIFYINSSAFCPIALYLGSKDPTTEYLVCGDYIETLKISDDDDKEGIETLKISDDKEGCDTIPNWVTSFVENIDNKCELKSPGERCFWVCQCLVSAEDCLEVLEEVIKSE
jgi:hypothetical protein